MFKILYRTGKTEEEFSKLEWIEKPRKENDEISPFFQEYLERIFPELIFIFKENRKETTRYKFSKGELDAICWWPKYKQFIIFEYKSKEPREKIEQICRYLGIISHGNNKDCIRLIDDLREFLPKSESLKHRDINWDETKLIWICPQIPSKNNLSEIWYYDNPNIIWVKSEWYKNESETAILLESEDKEEVLKKLSSRKGYKTAKTEIKDLSQLLQKIKFSKKETENWVERINKKILEEFLLNPKFRYYPESNWGEGVGIIEYRKDKKLFFWTRIVKSSLTIFFNLRKEEILLPLTKKHKTLFQFKGYWKMKKVFSRLY